MELVIPIIVEKCDMKEYSRAQRQAGKKIALVGTMGAVHAGHLSLVTKARELADIVICMIYINPTQFSVNEDFDRYPRCLEADALQMQQAGASAIFAPKSFYHTVSGMEGDKANVVGHPDQPHPDAHETWVTVERMQQGMCSTSRPHFFRGVATICVKMYNTMMPDVFVLGQKDYQQNRVVERLTRDLDFDVTVVEAPTVREEDGLALSSRNVSLSPPGRAQAAAIYAALCWAQQAAQQRQVTSAADIVQEVSERITAAGGKVDYVEVRDAQHLGPLTADITAQRAVIAVAAFFEGKHGHAVRLIDNIIID